MLFIAHKNAHFSSVVPVATSVIRIYYIYYILINLLINPYLFTSLIFLFFPSSSLLAHVVVPKIFNMKTL